MTGFSFTVVGLDKLLNLFDQLPGRVKSELSQELEVTASEITDGAKSDAPHDENRLTNSISFSKTGETNFEVVAQTDYAGYVEFGTKRKAYIPPGLEEFASQFKGPGSGGTDPIIAIQAWAKRKAGISNPRIIFLITRNILQFGINAHPYFFKQLQPAEENLKPRLANIIKDII